MEKARFFLPLLDSGWCELPDDQAHHAQRVLRLGNGDIVRVFDGQGRWANGRLVFENSGKARVYCDPPNEASVPWIHLTLASAVPKGDRADFLVEAASQLDVSVIRWIDCQRSVVKPEPQGGKMEKWRRLAIESAKQCGRARLLEIEPMEPIARVLKSAMATEDRLIWCNPTAVISLSEFRQRAIFKSQNGFPGRPLRATAFIGPEGGWTSAEMQMIADAGATAVRLGRNILRIETAAITVAAVMGCDNDDSLK